jgi:syntaxin 5
MARKQPNASISFIFHCCARFHGGFHQVTEGLARSFRSISPSQLLAKKERPQRIASVLVSRVVERDNKSRALCGVVKSSNNGIVSRHVSQPPPTTLLLRSSFAGSSNSSSSSKMCERTQEFAHIVSYFKDVSGKSKKGSLEVPRTRTAFNEAAAEIGRGVHKTSGLLKNLMKLVRRQGLFDDPTEEINNLIFRIKQDLDELNTKCDSAQQYIESKKSMFGSVSQSADHNIKVVGGLKSDLMQATKGFKSILELRSSKMKDQQVRKVELIGKGGMSPMRHISDQQQQQQQGSSSSGAGAGNAKAGIAANGKGAGAGQSSALTRKYNTPYSTPYDSAFQPDGDTAESGGQLERQFLLAPLAETQYYDSRERAVTEVEKTIGELGTLFKRLATMISEQQEMVERIDEDVENAVSTADRAHDLLLKAYESASSNRGLYMKLFGIFGAFVLFFIIFLM